MAAAARFLTFLFALLACSGAAHAQLPVPGRNAIALQVTAESDAPKAGGTVTLALAMKPDPGWHGYWQNPGDAGAAPRIDWQLPAGVEAGPILYPVPDRLMIAGLMNYVYEGRYTPLVVLRIPAGLVPGTRLSLRGTFHYLACTDTICVPESARITKDLVVSVSSAPPHRRALFDIYREALPKPLGSMARIENEAGRLRLAIPLPAALPVVDPYVFPLTEDKVEYSAPQIFSRSGDWLIVETKAAGDGGLSGTFQGVLRIGQGNGLAFDARPGIVPAAGEAISSGEEKPMGGPTLLLALAGAIVGGLLLNIMPCVFPILSLKALSLAKVGGDEAAARREALAYAAGVILVCMALGVTILALRSGGMAVGWAFQLQDPRVILLLLLLVTAIALNLAGLFALPAIGGGDRLARKGGAGGAFWTGALAAFVATPCTGPFMAAALGAALVLPTADALAVFAGLGLGLALPFLLLGFVPPLRRLLPRPGPWMERFRHILSLPMFATAIALAWILERQAGDEGVAIGLIAALVVAVALWRTGKSRVWPVALAGVATIAAILLVPTDRVIVTRTARTLSAEPFSEESLEKLRAQGRPVFVYFTADWCITCKVNEKAVLEREEVGRNFKRRNIEVLVGDWTRGDAAISRFLEKHGRSGVPLYLYYAPGKAPEVLPQILTVGQLEKMGN